MNEKILAITNKQEDIQMLAYEISSLSKTLKRAFEASKDDHDDLTYLEFTIDLIHKKNKIMQDKLETLDVKISKLAQELLN
ncbi:MAG: hypothetical protein ACLSWI_08000 [Candidatus Gastranaerophilaceae bacterium]